MKKSILALSILGAFSATAQAQSNVTLYGILDVNVFHQNNGLSTDANAPGGGNYLPNSARANSPVTGMGTSGLQPSRWGLTGSEDLGDGLRAVFTLESQINVAAGTNPSGREATAFTTGSIGQTASQEGSILGQMFDRESTAGLSSASFGTIKFGRQITVMGDAIGAYDPLRGSYAASPLGWNGGYSGAGFTAEARWDNSVKYNYSNGPFALGLQYMLGGTSAGADVGSAYAGSLDYALGSNFSIRAAYEHNRDAQLATGAGCSLGAAGLPASSCAGGAVDAGTLNMTYGDTNAYTIAAKYAIGSVTVKGGYEHIVTANPSDPAYDSTINEIYGIGVTQYNVTGFTNPRHEDMYWMGLNYQVTPSFEASAAYYWRDTNKYGTAAAAAAGTGTMSATSEAQYVSVILDYNFSKRTDIYTTAMTSRLSGPVWAGYNNVTTYTFGMRTKF